MWVTLKGYDVVQIKNSTSSSLGQRLNFICVGCGTSTMSLVGVYNEIPRLYANSDNAVL